MKPEGYTMVVHIVLLVAALVQCGDAISPHIVSHAVVDARHGKHGKVLHDKAADLEKTVLRLFSTTKHAGPLSDLVDSIVPLLDDMEEEINVSHHTAQGGLNASMVGFEACTTAKIYGEGNASEMLHSKNDLSASHRSCRNQEEDAKDDLDSCDALLHTLEIAKNASCDSYHWALRIPNVNLVPAPVEETYMEWIERVYVWVVAERNSVQTKMDQCSNETRAYNIKRSECQGADGDGGFKRAHEDMKLHCDNNQSALESQTCSYAHKVQETCDSYNVCYNATNTTLSAQLGDIQAAERSRQSEWWIVQRIRCYFQVFVEAGDGAVDSASLESCKNADHNTSHLTLIYPNVVSVPPECESVLTPCGTGYISSEYGLLPSKAEAKECTPCSFSQVQPQVLTCDVDAWPDKDHGLVCGECKVLVNNFNSKYQTCDGYCDTVGRECVGAWEEKRDTCEVKFDMTCGQTLSSSSDAICQCGNEKANVIHVLADDHAHGDSFIGKYFHFDISEVPGLEPETSHMYVHLKNLRSGTQGRAILWPGANGGGAGNAHGRFDPVAQRGDFEVNDLLEFTKEA